MIRLSALLAALAALPAFALPAFAEPEFRIRIDLDDEAAARLQELRRWIVVEAGYYGEVLPGAPEDDWGRVGLGYEAFTVYPASQVVEFGGSLSVMPVHWVEEPRVGIRISTSNAPDEPELLLCDFADRTVAGLVEDGETELECMLRED